MSRLRKNLDPVPAELKLARKIWGALPTCTTKNLEDLMNRHSLRVSSRDIMLLGSNWYVTHSGLVRLSELKACAGIHVRAVAEFCDLPAQRWAFKATVFKSRTCRGFVGYGDADPSNVSALVHGAEMRVAETRAVNRALRKAYGVGICSVEEIGSFSGPGETRGELKKHPPQSAHANGKNGRGPRVRDHLCQIIRQHQLDAVLVKSYAVDF
jgi:hypothetical protein